MIKLTDILLEITEIGEKTVQPHHYSWKGSMPPKLFKKYKKDGKDFNFLDQSEFVFSWDPGIKIEGKPVKMFAGLVWDGTIKHEGQMVLLGLEVSFGVINKNDYNLKNNLVGGGEIYRTLATVIDGIADFYDAYKDEIGYFKIEPESVIKGGSDDKGHKRMNLYRAYIQRHPKISPNFTVLERDGNLILVNKHVPEEYKDSLGNAF